MSLFPLLVRSLHGVRPGCRLGGGRNIVITFLLLNLVFFTSLCMPSARSEERLALSQPFMAKWQYETEETVDFTPAVRDGTIYVPFSSGQIVSLNGDDGELIWKSETGGHISASPVADEKALFVASESGKANSGFRSQSKGVVRALSLNSGLTMWERILPLPLRGALTSDLRNVYGAGRDGRVYAINKLTGDILWTKHFGEPFEFRPVNNNDLLFLGNMKGDMYALDKKTGAINWRYRTRGALRGSASIFNSKVYFGSADNHVYALDARRGQLLWRVRTGAEVQSVVHTPAGVLVASLDNFVYFLSPDDGGRLWKRQLAGRISAQPLVTADEALLTPLTGDACIVLDLKDGKLLNKLTVGDDNNTSASPVTAGGLLFITTRRGLLAFANQTSGP